MEDVALNLQRTFAGEHGTAAMHALRRVRDGRSRVMTTDAPVAALEARTREEFFGHLAHLVEND